MQYDQQARTLVQYYTCSSPMNVNNVHELGSALTVSTTSQFKYLQCTILKLAADYGQDLCKLVQAAFLATVKQAHSVKCYAYRNPYEINVISKC